MKLKKEIIVWRFLDGKIGHEKQSLALVNSLDLEIKLLNIPITNLIITTFINIRKLTKFSRPDLIIGVGHRVHISLLVAKSIEAVRELAHDCIYSHVSVLMDNALLSRRFVK